MKRSILSTTIGSHNTRLISELKVELDKYILTEDTDVTYGYRNINGGSIVFITGKNEFEKELKPFTFPILSNDAKGNEIVYLDVRQMVDLSKDKDSSEDGVVELDEIIRDKGMMKLVTIQAMYTLLLKDTSDMGPMFKGSVKSISGWISSTIAHALMLNVNEARDLNAVVIKSMINIYDEDKSFKVIPYMITTLLMNDRLTEEEVIDIIGDDAPVVHNIKEMVEYIKDTNISSKLEMLTVESFVNILKSTVFGIGLSSRIALALEHMPTWIAISYEVADNRLYQKTQLANYLTRNNKILDIKSLVKTVDAELKIVKVNLSREDTDPDYNDMLPKGTSLFRTTNHSVYIVEAEGYKLYRFYLGTVMDSNNDTAEILEAFKDADREVDQLELIVNSNGGMVNQGTQIMTGIKNTFGDRITTILNNTGKSMGALLFCIGNTRIVNKYSDLMFHQYSGGTFGKGDDLVTDVNHNYELIGNLFRDTIVKPEFMTEKEFKRMQDGHDYWMMIDEMIERGIATHVNIDGKLVPASEYVS